MNQFLLLLALWLTIANSAFAQTDVLLLTDGREIPACVLSITPQEMRYQSPGSADTLRLPVDAIFLIRYANGTREVFHPISSEMAAVPDSLYSSLLGLSTAQRQALGREAADRNYHNYGVFWITLASTVYGTPALGIISPIVIGRHQVALGKLNAPQPALLNDPAYGEAYRREAYRRKRNTAWLGFSLGAAAWVLLLSSMNSSGN